MLLFLSSNTLKVKYCFLDIYSIFITILFLPVIWIEGKWLRSRTPILKPPTDADFGVIFKGSGKKKVICIGESPICGLGIQKHSDGLSCQLAKKLSNRYDITIRWEIGAFKGAKAAHAIKDILPKIKSKHIDLVVLGFGVNDAKGFTRPQTYFRNLSTVIKEFQKSNKEIKIIVSGGPALGSFPFLPQPLRHILGIRVKLLDNAAKKLVSDNVRFAPISFHYVESLYCHDHFHPSKEGHELWAEIIADAFPLEWFKRGKEVINEEYYN